MCRRTKPTKHKSLDLYLMFTIFKQITFWLFSDFSGLPYLFYSWFLAAAAMAGYRARILVLKESFWLLIIIPGRLPQELYRAKM